MSVFGPLVSAHQVEDDVETAIKTWIHSYLGEAEREFGIDPGFVQRPNAYRKTAHGIFEVPDTQLPRIIVSSPGLSEEPEFDGEQYTAVWAMTVGIIVKGQDERDTMKIVRIYAAALRQLLVQKGGLEDWLDEDYSSAPAEAEKTLASGELTLTVRRDGVVTRWAGPAAPLPEPSPGVPPVYPDYSAATGETSGDFTPYRVDQDLP